MTNDDVRFDGRVILVTGGGRGLGQAQARLLASRGAKLVVADNGSAMDGEHPDAGLAETVVEEIKAAGGEALAFTDSLADESGAIGAVEACLSEYDRIDGLIHYASTCPAPSPPDQMSTEVLDKVMQINVYAGLFMARTAWPHMVRQGYGRLVFVPSAGSYGAPGALEYGTAKAAYYGMIRCLAVEGASHGLFVNGVSPAASTRMTAQLPDTPFWQWYRNAMAPEKVAAGAAFLLSEECSVTGESFAMGGGRIARISFAEADGVIAPEGTLEDVRRIMPQVMADSRFFYPKTLSERSAKVAALFGFDDAPVNYDLDD